MADGDNGNDDETFRAPLPREDRLWRHPSELAAEAVPVAGSGRSAWRPLFGALAGGVCVVGALWFLTGGNASEGPTVTAAGADDGVATMVEGDTDSTSDTADEGSAAGTPDESPSGAPLDGGDREKSPTTTAPVATTSSLPSTDDSTPQSTTTAPTNAEPTDAVPTSAEPTTSEPSATTSTIANDDPDAPTGWLGVMLRDAEGGDGAVVSEVVPDGPADHAGIQVDDRIVEVGGVAVGSAAEAVDAIHRHEPGAEVAFRVHRHGSESIATVALGAGPDH